MPEEYYIQREERQAAKRAIMQKAMQYGIGDLMMFHQMRYVAERLKSPSFTKKGPGRKHKQGKKKH